MRMHQDFFTDPYEVKKTNVDVNVTVRGGGHNPAPITFFFGNGLGVG